MRLATLAIAIFSLVAGDHIIHGVSNFPGNSINDV